MLVILTANLSEFYRCMIFSFHFLFQVGSGFHGKKWNWEGH
jgi:hypothetical protein